MPIRLVLSTDLLGEGLDLRAASVIVHLDLPWTAARMDQREGRATRLGSPHARVSVYAMRPPPAAARALDIHRRISAKRAAMTASLAAGDAREALCALVRPWLTADAGRARIAAVSAEGPSWIAVVRDADERTRVVVGEDGAVEENDARLFTLLSLAAQGVPVHPAADAIRRAQQDIRRWMRGEQSAAAAQARNGTSPVRVAIARRFDLALRQSTLGERAALQAKFASAMRVLGAQRSAGVDRLLQEAVRSSSIEEALQRIAAIADARITNRPAARRTRVLALLLLVRDGRAATDPSSAPRSAASSGTVGPR